VKRLKSADMSEELNLKRAIEQLLEIDAFFTGDMAVKGPALNFPEPAGFVSPASPAQLPAEVKQAVSEPVIQYKIGENMTKTQALEIIAEQVRACRACPLGSTRLNAVPGEGDPDAAIVFVGEAPGADEDSTGRPFVGRAGKLLTDIIAAMGLKREQVYICNTLKCRPPGNRDPLPSEKDACRHFLRSQLDIIKPKVIVALGSHAARELLATDEAIGKLRGVFQQYKTSPNASPIKLMPTYHPAYLLRNYSPDNRRRVWEDMQLVMAELGLKIPKKQVEKE